VDKQSTDTGITLLADPADPILSSGRVPVRCEVKLSCELPAGFEQGGDYDRCNDRAGGDWTDAGDRFQSPAQFIRTVPGVNLMIDLTNLLPVICPCAMPSAR
jgi:hypothetical protein